MPIKHTLFISDLHLTPDQPKIVELFLNFLTKEATKAEALYILGDFFRLWLGDDHNTQFNTKTIHALKNLSAKIPIYIMQGNRDFALGKLFAKKSNCTLLTDPHKINLYGIPTLLSHGDIFCTNNIKYLIFRNLIGANKTSIKIFLSMPIAIRRWIAEFVHKHSSRNNKIGKKRKTQEMPKILYDKMNRSIIKELIKHNAKQLIHGHIHKANQKNLHYGNKQYNCLTLDAWNDESGNFLIFREDGSYAIKNYSLTGSEVLFGSKI